MERDSVIRDFVTGDKHRNLCGSCCTCSTYSGTKKETKMLFLLPLMDDLLFTLHWVQVKLNTIDMVQGS
jgi:hypothetical protein